MKYITDQQILEITAEVSRALQIAKIPHLVGGSLAYKIYTKDPNVTVHDVDIIVHQDDFPKIAKLLAQPSFNLDPIVTPFSIHANHREFKGEDGKSFDISLDSFEHYYQGFSVELDMNDHKGYPVGSENIQLISLDGLIKVYKIALEGNNVSKFPAYKEKINTLVSLKQLE